MLKLKKYEVNFIQYSIRGFLVFIQQRIKNPGKAKHMVQIKLKAFSQSSSMFLFLKIAIKKSGKQCEVIREVRNVIVIKYIVCQLLQYYTIDLIVIPTPQYFKKCQCKLDLFLSQSIFVYALYITIKHTKVNPTAVKSTIKFTNQVIFQYFAKSSIVNFEQKQKNRQNSPILYNLCYKLQDESQIMKVTQVNMQAQAKQAIQQLKIVIYSSKINENILIAIPIMIKLAENIIEDFNENTSTVIPIRSQGIKSQNIYVKIWQTVLLTI
ncbi:hypothetical protein ABPG72_006609 [Tetrahymena utriculariae]